MQIKWLNEFWKLFRKSDENSTNEKSNEELVSLTSKQ